MIDEIQQLADRAAPDLLRAFRAAVDQARRDIDHDELTAAIIAEDIAAVREIVGVADDDHAKFRAALGGDGVASLVEALTGVFTGAALAAVAALGLPISPRPATAAKSYTREIVAGIVADSARAAREGVERAFASSDHPHTKAARIRATIGLTARQAANLERLREALIDPVFRARIIVGGTVRQLPVMRNLSASQRSSVRKAINDGLTPETAEAILEKHRRDLVNHRARAIANTEAQRAANAGELEAWKQAREHGVIPDTARRYWRTAGDERVRALHNAIPAMNVKGRGLTEPFATPFGPLMYPPAEINCRCRVILKVTNTE